MGRGTGRSILAVAALAALQSTLAIVDWLTMPDAALAALYIAAVVLMPLAAGARATALFALASTAVAVGVGLEHGYFDDGHHYLRIGLLALAGGVATIIAAGRSRLRQDVERLTLLAALGDVAASGGGFDAAARGLLELAVPELADGATVSVERADGPSLVARVGAEPGRAGRTVTIALRVGGRTLGTLALTRTRLRRGFRGAELRVLEALAGRAALALENARLIDDLSRAERELTGVLNGLAEAVTVQRRDGTLAYANEAAARLLGLPSAQDVVEAAPADLVARFETTLPDGRPLDADLLPGRRVLAGEAEPAPLLTRSISRATGEERWNLTKATAIPGRDGRPVLAVNVIEDVTDTTRAQQRDRLIAEAGDVLAASSDPTDTLERLAVLLATRVADWCGIDMPGEDGQVRMVAAAHRDPERIALARELRERYPIPMDLPAGLPAVLRGGPSFRQEAITDEDLQGFAQDEEHLALLRRIGFGHVLVVPMRASGETVGAITLVRAAGAPAFRDDEAELAEELGARSATAMLGARLYAARLRVAETLQRSLLPPALPAVPGLAFASHYAAAGRASEVGGDFYDALPLPDGLLLLIGDVTGKGAEAAALTALARAALEAVAAHSGSATAALAHLNALLLRRQELALLSVATACLRRSRTGDEATVEIVCAGHPMALLVRDGVVEPVGRPGSLLGAFADAAWSPMTLGLQDGDVLLLRTDGVTDTVGPDGERFGEERVQRALDGLAAGDAAGAVVAVRDAIAAFQAGEQSDDVALVAVGVESVRDFCDATFAGPMTGNGGPRTMLMASKDAGAHPTVLRFGLDGTPASVALARRIVERELADLPRTMLNDARLLVSELASNAVKHAGGGAYELVVDRQHGGVRVEVVDYGSGFSPSGAAQRAGEPGEGGYGLGLVDRLSRRWGVERSAGTSVWFELPVG